MIDLDREIEEARALGLTVDTGERTVSGLTPDNFYGRSEDEIEEMSSLVCCLVLHGYTEIINDDDEATRH